MTQNDWMKKLRCYGQMGQCPHESCSEECPYYVSETASMVDAFRYAADTIETMTDRWESVFSEDPVSVQLSKTMCKNVSEFIKDKILDDIRTDEYIDNPDYVFDLLFAAKLLDAAQGV